MGRMDTCICMAKSLCCPPGTITTLLTGYQFSSVELLSRAYLSPHRLQHTRLPCPSPTAGACSNSCPSSCFIDYVNIIQPSHPLLSPSPPAFREKEHPQASVFSNKSVLCIRWPKYWGFSFSISPSNEYSGLISFRMDWFNLQSKELSKVFSNTTVQKH